MYSAQLGSIADNSLAGFEPGTVAAQRFSSLATDARTSKTVRAIQRARMERSRIFGEDLFSDPAWSILLELYAFALEQRRITISTISRRSKVSLTTVLRWLDALMKKELVQRDDDPFDGRMVRVSLTPKGLNAMHDLFATIECVQLRFDSERFRPVD